MENTQDLKTEFRDPRSLIPHKDNPRDEIDPETPEMIELSEDIAKNGLISPIVITEGGQILAGHRRRRAACIRAGINSVPVIIRELKDTELPEDFFASENLQRQDLSPLEEARLFRNLRTKLEAKSGIRVGVMDLARRLNIAQNTISLRLAIFELPESVQHLIHIREIPPNASRKLAELKDYPGEIEKFANRMVTRDITLSSLSSLVARRLQALSEQPEQERDIDSSKAHRVRPQYKENYDAPVVTRAVAVANLEGKLGGTIRLSTIKHILDVTCCNCGMLGMDSICNTCPLPKFINGIVGRSDGPQTRSEIDIDDD